MINHPNRSKRRLISDLVTKGPLPYQHHYMLTMSGGETADHVLEPPKALVTLAERHPNAAVSWTADRTALLIHIDGRVWAHEMAGMWPRDFDDPPPQTLPKEVWQYVRLALGETGDTYA